MDNILNIVLTCPGCGNSSWVRRDDGFKCLACGDFSYPEDMCSTVKEVQSNDNED